MRAFLVGALLLLLLPTEAALVRVAVFHRHGARSPMGIVDAKPTCGPPFCALNDVGIDQCRAVGDHLNATYTAPLGLPSPYNVSFIRSQATSPDRVVMSAESVVMGLYAGQEALPFVEFPPIDQNVMLSPWSSMPAWILSGREKAMMGRMDPPTVAAIGLDNIAYIGRLLGLPCDSTPFSCAYTLEDTLLSNISLGVPSDARALAMLPTLKTLVATFMNTALGYDNGVTDDFSVQVGSLGYAWAQDVLQFFAGPPSLRRVQHYAGHDWTMSCLFGTLGAVAPAAVNDSSTLPVFADTLIVELHNNTGVLSVRFFRGNPTQPKSLTYTYAQAPLSVRCRSADNQTSLASECLLADWRRHVDSTGPASPLGSCYYTQAWMADANCLTSDAPPVGSACAFFRANCPAVPCGLQAGALADTSAGFACRSQDPPDDPPYFAATVVALVAPSLLAGAIAGFYGVDKLRALIACGSKGEEATPLYREPRE